MDQGSREATNRQAALGHIRKGFVSRVRWKGSRRTAPDKRSRNYTYVRRSDLNKKLRA
jgi:hypothetical protein